MTLSAHARLPSHHTSRLQDHSSNGGRREGAGTHKVELQLRELGVQLLDLLLAVDEVHGEAIDGVIKRDALAAAGGVGQLVDVGGLRLGRQDLGGLLQLGQGVDGEGGAGELCLGGGLDAEDKGLGPVAAVICPWADALGLEEAEVAHEEAGGVDLFCAVLVVDMCDVVELDLVCVDHVEWVEWGEMKWLVDDGVYGCDDSYPGLV